ncbi:L-threonine ammonia-lyase-like isoform X1 [Onthophagus taurus]|uniref:L-threonine ammonia-lyase-like isoform X1 n=2 Tax=Onthophagus taurus TaxID=166361 RepID=UPI0039BE3A9F
MSDDCSCDLNEPIPAAPDSDCSCSIDIFPDKKADTNTECSCSTHIPNFHDTPKEPSTKTESILKACTCSSYVSTQPSKGDSSKKSSSAKCACPSQDQSVQEEPSKNTSSAQCYCPSQASTQPSKGDSSKKSSSAKCACPSQVSSQPSKRDSSKKSSSVKCACPSQVSSQPSKGDSSKTGSTRCTCSSHGISFGDIEPEKPIIPGKKYRKCGCPPKSSLKSGASKCTCSSHAVSFGDTAPAKPNPPEKKRKCGCPPKGTSVKSPLQPILDPNCDPDNPKMLSFDEVRNARANINGAVVKTPLINSKLSELYGMNIYLKNEFLQYTGSFKERGARNALMNMSETQKRTGAISASAGNHALALCYHGQELGIPITVVMPVVAPIMKIQNCKEFGAEIIVKGADMVEAKTIAQHLAQERGALYINGYDHIDVLAGQGTLGIEILEQLPSACAIVVPAGGGGLLAGIAVAVKSLKPCSKVIGAESENCPSFTNSMKAGKPVLTPSRPTVADGLAVPLPGYNSVHIAKSFVDKMTVVKEDDITVAMLRLIEKEKYIVEGAGATALAAIASGQLDEFKGKNVVVVLSGGNIDTTVLGRVLERGLAAEGRFLKVYVTVSDRAGGVSDLIRLISSIGVSIKNISQEREWLIVDVFSVKVKVVCETRDWDHACELKQLLEQNYSDITMVHVDFPPSTRSGKTDY